MKALRFLHTLLLSAALALNGLAPASAHAVGMEAWASAGTHSGSHCSVGLGSAAAGRSSQLTSVVQGAGDSTPAHVEHAMHSGTHEAHAAAGHVLQLAGHEHAAMADEHAGSAKTQGCGADAPADCCQDGSCAHSCVCQVPVVTTAVAVGRAPAAASIIPVRAYDTVRSLTGPPLLEPPIR